MPLRGRRWLSSSSSRAGLQAPTFSYRAQTGTQFERASRWGWTPGSACSCLPGTKVHYVAHDRGALSPPLTTTTTTNSSSSYASLLLDNLFPLIAKFQTALRHSRQHEVDSRHELRLSDRWKEPKRRPSCPQRRPTPRPTPPLQSPGFVGQQESFGFAHAAQQR